MAAFIIHIDHKIKETFSYQRPLNEGSIRALREYAKANYGKDAVLQCMTPDEENEFHKNGSLMGHPNWLRTTSG